MHFIMLFTSQVLYIECLSSLKERKLSPQINYTSRCVPSRARHVYEFIAHVHHILRLNHYDEYFWNLFYSLSQIRFIDWRQWTYMNNGNESWFLTFINLKLITVWCFSVNVVAFHWVTQYSSSSKISANFILSSTATASQQDAHKLNHSGCPARGLPFHICSRVKFRNRKKTEQ